MQFSEVYYVKSKSNAAIINVCRPAVDRWEKRFEVAKLDYEKYKKFYDHAKSIDDPAFIANTETDMKATNKSYELPENSHSQLSLLDCKPVPYRCHFH